MIHISKSWRITLLIVSILLIQIIMEYRISILNENVPSKIPHVYDRIPTVIFSSIYFSIGLLSNYKLQKVLLGSLLGVIIGVIAAIITFLFSDYIQKLDFLIHCILLFVVLYGSYKVLKNKIDLWI